MKRYFILILFCIIPLFAVSCGEEAPPGTAITINPASRTVTLTVPSTSTCPVASAGPYRQDFVIEVKDGKGNPMANTTIKISYPWAQPYAAVVQLYDGNTPKNSPMTVTTNDVGVYNLRFDYYTGSNWKGDLEVRTGDAFGSATFEMKCEVGT